MFDQCLHTHHHFFPKIIVRNFSLAIVEAVLDSFNKINLLYYLDKCYKILKEEREEYLNTISVICSDTSYMILKDLLRIQFHVVKIKH